MPVQGVGGNVTLNVNTLNTVGDKPRIGQTPLSVSPDGLRATLSNWDARKSAANRTSKAVISKLTTSRANNGATRLVRKFTASRSRFARACGHLLGRLLPRGDRAGVASHSDLKTAQLRMKNLLLFEKYLPEMHSSAKPEKLAQTLSGLPPKLLSRANANLQHDVMAAANNKLLSFRKRDGFKNAGDRAVMRQLVAATLVLEGYDAAAKLKQGLASANAKARADGTGAEFSKVLKSSRDLVHAGVKPSAAFANDLKNAEKTGAPFIPIDQERQHYATFVMRRAQHPERPEHGRAKVSRTKGPPDLPRWDRDASDASRAPTVRHKDRNVRKFVKLSHNSGALTGPEADHLAKNFAGPLSRLHGVQVAKKDREPYQEAVTALMQLPAFRATGADSDHDRLNNLRGLLYVAALHDPQSVMDGRLQAIADKLCALPAEDVDSLVRSCNNNEWMTGGAITQVLQSAAD